MWGFWILVVLIVLLILSGPWYPYSRGWGYRGLGILAALVIIWLLIIWSGSVAFWWPGAEPLPPVTTAPQPATTQ